MLADPPPAIIGNTLTASALLTSSAFLPTRRGALLSPCTSARSFALHALRAGATLGTACAFPALPRTSAPRFLRGFPFGTALRRLCALRTTGSCRFLRGTAFGRTFRRATASFGTCASTGRFRPRQRFTQPGFFADTAGHILSRFHRGRRDQALAFGGARSHRRARDSAQNGADRAADGSTDNRTGYPTSSLFRYRQSRSLTGTLR